MFSFVHYVQQKCVCFPEMVTNAAVTHLAAFYPIEQESQQQRETLDKLSEFALHKGIPFQT